MDIAIERIASVLSDCRSIQFSRMHETLSELDRFLWSLRICSCELGDLLDDILVVGQLQVDENDVNNLRQLHICLNQLYVEYETKLLFLLNRSSASASLIGQPKKIINLSMVCVCI